MAKILVSWIGKADLLSVEEEPAGRPGPIAQAIRWETFDRCVLLSNYGSRQSRHYVRWLAKQAETEIALRLVDLDDPTDFEGIYRVVLPLLEGVFGERRNRVSLHLSPGTPAMAAMWILLAKTRFPARLIKSSPERGVEIASVPFDITAEFVPAFIEATSRQIEDAAAGVPEQTSGFEKILHRSEAMARVIGKAKKAAGFDVSVLIEGESGTGKELVARAMHSASPRKHGPFMALNCGAIPEQLVESQLFGHVKGAFTGATSSSAGVFEAASGGTVFLDEIGELPLESQVKLLRVLEVRQVTRLGATKPVDLNVRILSATNRRLAAEIRGGRFREDLYYRLAVATLRIPPLRERSGDFDLILDAALAQISREFRSGASGLHKKISQDARKLLSTHSWPGNVRELQNVLLRAYLWSDNREIGLADARDALGEDQTQELPNLPLGQIGHGFNIREFMAEVAREHLSRALEQSQGNKSEAARLLGLSSYQTFTNWARRFGGEE